MTMYMYEPYRHIFHLDFDNYEIWKLSKSKIENEKIELVN